jgi:hypothetical protein
MKNRSENGWVHFDSETAQQCAIYRLAFEHRGRQRVFVLLIPFAIKARLKGEHFDQAVQVGRRTIDQAIIMRAIEGDFDSERVNRVANGRARLAILEHLYNAFTLEQAQAGNQVWQTPPTMQHIGPDPADDFKN